MTREKVFQTVINKAWDDENYRQQLVSSPAQAIKSATGYDIPADAKVVVLDQTDPSVMHINIPPKPNYDNMELSDEQLEVVAGGEVWIATLIVSAAGAGSAVAGSKANDSGGGW